MPVLASLYSDNRQILHSVRLDLDKMNGLPELKLYRVLCALLAIAHYPQQRITSIEKNCCGSFQPADLGRLQHLRPAPLAKLPLMSLDLLGRRIVFVLVSDWLGLGHLRCPFPWWLGLWFGLWRWFVDFGRPRSSREIETMSRVDPRLFKPKVTQIQHQAVKIWSWLFHRMTSRRKPRRSSGMWRKSRLRTLKDRNIRSLGGRSGSMSESKQQVRLVWVEAYQRHRKIARGCLRTVKPRMSRHCDHFFYAYSDSCPRVPAAVRRTSWPQAPQIAGIAAA
jgi:hypothetical protein